MPIVRVAPASVLRGVVRVPPDKSITHRALLLGSLSDRAVTVTRPLDSEDTAATLHAVEALRAEVRGRLGDRVEVRGRGLRGLAPPPALDCANAGTLMRLITGILVGLAGDHTLLDGDDSLRRRPMLRVARPLRAMGAAVWTTPEGTPPLVVSGGRPLQGLEHELEVASAQVKSCLLLAGLLAEGVTRVKSEHRSRDHTERMLAAAGVPLRRTGTTVTVAGVDALALGDVAVPADASSAAFAVAAGVLVAGSRLLVRDCGANWTRTGFLRILRRMGAVVLGDLEAPSAGVIGPVEPVTDLEVAAGTLNGVVVEPEEVPLAIDELPLVALLGCYAEGETIVRGAQELRVKESDRIATVVDGLRVLGADIEATQDGFAVRGTGGLRGGTIVSQGDHRIAMLGAVAGLASRDGVRVEGMEAAAVSYPRFMDDIADLR